MKKIRKKFFSTTLGVVGKGMAVMLCMVVFGLFLGEGCKKDDEKKPVVEPPEPEYPIDVPFTEYVLSETCQWVNLDYDEKVIIVNNDRELGNYTACEESNYPEIDFSKHSLLLASGQTSGEIIEYSVKYLQQFEKNEYDLNVEMLLSMATSIEKWNIALITNKIKEENEIKLNVKNQSGLKESQWKLVGIIDEETGILTELDSTSLGIPQDSIYRLSFDIEIHHGPPLQPHYNLFGQGWCNRLEGTYEVDYITNNISIFLRMSTLAGQTKDEILYIESLNNVTRFLIQEKKLLLYFDEHYYLLFKLLES